MTSAATPFFFVLDLTDPVAFAIAAASGQSEASLRDKRQAVLESGAIPALTLGMSLAGGNAILAHGWARPPVPGGSARYVAVVSEGRLTVRQFSLET